MTNPHTENQPVARISRRFGISWKAALLPLLLSACQSDSPYSDDAYGLIAQGERIFFNETFGGNGRTCGTCHRVEDNFALSPAFIATLPPEDPLFVAETRAALAENFEIPPLMRSHGLILGNQDGFEDLAGNFNMRGIPHLLSLATSVQSGQGPRIGWSGDGAPGEGTLRSFAVGAVTQHFTRTTRRSPGVDFRLPSERELDALEAYMLSLGRQQDLTLPLDLKGSLPALGQQIFLDDKLSKCNICHFNAGASADPAVFGDNAGNLSFNTGVEALRAELSQTTGIAIPPDDGFGVPGNGEFNTPPLVEAADTSPFFHNNSAATLEASVAFYNTEAFNSSPAGQMLVGLTGQPVKLNDSEVRALVAFMQTINALENIRTAMNLLQEASGVANLEGRGWNRLLLRAGYEVEDAFQVLQAGELNPPAQNHLQKAMALIGKARAENTRGVVKKLSYEAMVASETARSELVSSSATADH